MIEGNQLRYWWPGKGNSQQSAWEAAVILLQAEIALKYTGDSLRHGGAACTGQSQLLCCVAATRKPVFVLLLHLFSSRGTTAVDAPRANQARELR